MLTAYDANLDLKAARKSQEISGYYYQFALHIGQMLQGNVVHTGNVTRLFSNCWIKEKRIT